jgi:hypothetical protein
LDLQRLNKLLNTWNQRAVKLNTFMQDNSSCDSALALPTSMTADCVSSVCCKQEIVPRPTASFTSIISYVERVKNEELEYEVDRMILQ